MDEAFIIMQIGNTEMDAVCDGAIVPAIEQANLLPRRVDRHNTGNLLKSEIITFIERSAIIVADVTNERPNCYLEIGYAMGLGKQSNLILTAREDHHHSSPNFDRSGPKIHFDLEGYDILFWKAEDLPAFQAELAARIQRRAAIIAPGARAQAEAEAPFTWVEGLRERALQGLHKVDLSGHMEVSATVAPSGQWSQRELLEQLRDASVHNFGWPIALVMEGNSNPEDRPRPTSDGVEAEVSISAADGRSRTSYDFWKLFNDGRFYTLLSLFEDSRAENVIFWDVRVSRVTESLLLLARLYRRLGAADRDMVTVRVRHGGLAGREMRVADPHRLTWEGRTTVEEAVERTITVPLVDLEDDLGPLVKQLLDPLFMVFDFFEVSEEIVTEVADRFINRG